MVCAWIGNSVRVAAKHCLQVTDAHFNQAVSAADGALQIPVQQCAATPRNDPQADGADHDKSAFCGSERHIAAHCDDLAPLPMGPAGFEPATNRL